MAFFKRDKSKEPQIWNIPNSKPGLQQPPAPPQQPAQLPQYGAEQLPKVTISNEELAEALKEIFSLINRLQATNEAVFVNLSNNQLHLNNILNELLEAYKYESEPEEEKKTT